MKFDKKVNLYYFTKKLGSIKVSHFLVSLRTAFEQKKKNSIYIYIVLKLIFHLVTITNI